MARIHCGNRRRSWHDRAPWYRLAAAVVCLFAGPAFADGQGSAPSAADWPMFRGNSRLTGVAGTTLGKELRVRWKFDTGEAVTSSAAIVDGMVYVGADDGALYALDLKTGDVHWKTKFDEAIRSSPAVVQGMVILGDSEGILHGVSATTGKKKWSFATNGEIISSPNPVGDRVVFGSYDGSLYCVAIDDGRLLWKFETEGRIHGTPGVAGDRVLVAGCDEHLYSVSLSDGSGEPCISMGSVAGTSAAIDGSMVFIGTYSGAVLGVNWKERRTVWRFDDPERDFPCMSSAAIGKELIVVGGRDKRVRAIEKDTGKLRWTFATRSRVDSSPVIVGDRVFVGSSDGNLYALAMRDGSRVWMFETGSPISASPAVAQRCLVIGTEDGLVYCFSSN